MDKKPLIGIILCLILLLGIGVPTNGEKTEAISNGRDIYFFDYAFISGEYEHCEKWFGYYNIWNSNYSIHSINVLGYSSYQDKYIPVKAYSVHGNNRIGFIGRHHCCIFSFFHVTVEGY